jgi:hypothetical protein
MPASFQATKVRPENAVLVYSFNLTNNAPAMWAMNGVSLLFLFLFGWLLLFFVQQIRPGIMAEVFSGTFNPLLVIVILIGVFVAQAVAHELIHGIFFWVFIRQRPKFGFRGWYAFAAAPGWFFPPGQYLVIALAPLMLLSILGMVLVAVVPSGTLAAILFGIVANAAGAVGDMWIVFKVLRERRKILIEDLGDGINFYAPG